jgi:hypothetical protein
MGKASSAKKVARAARSGGGRRAGQQRNWVFPGAIAVIAILGVLLIAFARSEDAAEADIQPLLGEHWHAAFGINVCGEWQAPLSDVGEDKFGIHTHGDGIIHIHPFTSGAAGKKARVSRFFDQVTLAVGDGGISLPGGDEFEAGEDTCDDEAATVRLLRWDSPQDETPEVITEDITDARFLADREVFALVFGPADAEVEQPPSVPNLDQLTDVDPADPFAADPSDTTATSVAEDGTATSVAEDGTSTSSSTPEGDDSTTSTSTPPAEDSTTSSSTP